MFAGLMALVVRYVLYGAGGVLVGLGVATAADSDRFCLSVSAMTDLTVSGISMVVSGGAMFVGSTIWSRLVKRRPDGVL